jgi:hypothetical protein
MQSALEGAFAELVLASSAPASDAESMSAWLERHGVAPEDRAALLEQGMDRLLTYRELVRENLWDALELAVPRSMARLGPVFEEYFSLFLARRGPRSHYLRDVTRELIDFCEPLWSRDTRVPAYLTDLARHEALRIELGALAAGQAPADAGELELDLGVRFSPAARLMQYAYAVHELSEAPADRASPPQRPTWLMVYRSPEHEVRYLELSRLAAEILRRLMHESASLRAALTCACESQGIRLDQSVIEGTARVLSDLAQRGALLGPRPAGELSP